MFDSKTIGENSAAGGSIGLQYSLTEALKKGFPLSFEELDESRDKVIKWGLKVVKGEASLRYAEFEAPGAEEIYHLIMNRLGHQSGCPCWACLRQK